MDLSFEIRSLAAGVVCPAILTALILWGGRKIPTQKPTLRDLALGGLAIALSFFVAYNYLGWAPRIPEQSWQFLPYLAVAAVLWDIGGSAFPSWALFVLRLVGSCIAVVLLVPVREEMEGVRLLWQSALAATILSLWVGLPGLARRASSGLFLLVTAALAGGAAGLLVTAGTAKFAQLAGVAAVSLAMAGGICLLAPSNAIAEGMVPGIAILFPGLLVSGLLGSFSEVPTWCYVVLALAPLGGWLYAVRPWKWLFVVGALGPALAAVGWALQIYLMEETW